MAVRWWVEDCFFFQAEDGIRDLTVTGVQTCALPISIAAIGLPGVLKTRRLGYDGKGQAVIRTAADARRAWSALGAAPLLYEEWIPFDCEASIIGARRDRKSTRLNSSHSQISYAVFCLKKKKK